jgi:hypothetical protein
MSSLQSQFVIKKYSEFGGNFIDSDYLAASLDTGKPHVFDDLFVKIYSAQNKFKDKPLIGSTRGVGNVKTIPVEVFRWFLQGADYKSLRVVENLESANAAPGIGGGTFRIKLDQDWVGAPEVLMGEDNDYSVRIVNGPIPDGDGFIYEVYIEDDDTSRFFPVELLEPGREFCKSWTSVPSEMNDEFGGQEYPSSYMLESQVGAFAQKLKITDKALREHGRIGVKLQDREGRMVERFIPMAEQMMFDELEMSKEVQLTYGKRSTKPGPRGYWIKTGPGLRQQLRDGWIKYFNSDITESELESYLMDIFFSRTDRSERKVTFMTGTMASIMFHRMLANSARGFLTVDHNYIERVGSSPRHLSFGAQFTHYQGAEGIEVDLMYNPLYDDLKYCKKTHPDETNRPIDSWRMTVMDYSAPKNSGFGSNLNYLEVANTYTHGYVTGTVGPNGPISGGATTELVGAYKRFVQGTAGIQLVDATRSGELIFEYE